MRISIYLAMPLVLLAMLSMATTNSAAQEAQVDRTELPIKGPWYPPITELDARDAKAPPVFEVKAPKKHPTWLSFCWTILALAAQVPRAAF